MGKKKWKRIRLHDLASAAEQERVLKALVQVKVQPEAESPENEGPDSATTGQSEGGPTLTPHRNQLISHRREAGARR